MDYDELPTSIYDHPPKGLEELHRCLKEFNKGPLNYFDAVVVSASWAWYKEQVDAALKGNT